MVQGRERISDSQPQLWWGGQKRSFPTSNQILRLLHAFHSYLPIRCGASMKPTEKSNMSSSLKSGGFPGQTQLLVTPIVIRADILLQLPITVHQYLSWLLQLQVHTLHSRQTLRSPQKMSLLPLPHLDQHHDNPKCHRRATKRPKIWDR